MQLTGKKALRLPDSLSENRFRTTVRIDRYTWTLFKKRTRALGLDTCMVVESLIKAWLFGTGGDIPQVKPMQINMTVNYKVSRPRRLPDIATLAAAETREIQDQVHGCKYLKVKGHYPGRVGFCTWLKQWIFGHECEGCYHSGQ